MRVSAENPAFGTPLIGFPEHKIFMSHPLFVFILIGLMKNYLPFHLF
ncbi:hypothetical protein HUZ99_01915 [Staphylococcus sp. SS87]|nr:hypothetical protein [Staphylococcus singaporensis]